MRDAQEILSLYTTRKNRDEPTHAKLREILHGILGETDLPLPELDKYEKPAVANLMLIGVTQTADRISSTMPDPYYPAVHPGFAASEDKARIRKARVKDWWDTNNFKLLQRRRARHYLAYASAPMLVKPDPKGDFPRWELRSPLETFPSDLPIGQVVPDDVIFTYQQTAGWIENRYPGTLRAMGLKENPDQQITLLQYIDSAQISFYAVSDRIAEPEQGFPTYGIQNLGVMPTKRGPVIQTLSEERNPVERPLCVIPQLIGLDRPQSMYEGLLGLFQNQAKLMALELTGMIRSIWPEEWIVGANGLKANIITQADPQAGVIGEIENGDIKVHGPTPAQFGVNLMDRLERAQRLQAHIPAEFGGESSTNTRTDKRGNSILSATIDFQIQAAHEAFEIAMREENDIAADIDKKCFPEKKTFDSTLGQSVYFPADLWEDRAVHWVRYAAAGSDADGLVVAGGQRLGIGTLSKKGFMEIDPLVDDPEMETERVRSEQLEAMLFQSLTALAQQDPNYMTVIAQLDAMLRKDTAPDIFAAWLKLDQAYKAQQQQAQQPQIPGADTQPGLADAGAAIGAPPAALSNLGQLHQILRHTGGNLQPRPGPAGQLMGATAGP